MAAASRATRIDRAGTRIFETGIFSTISNANLYGSGALMSVTCSVLSERGKYRRGSGLGASARPRNYSLARRSKRDNNGVAHRTLRGKWLEQSDSRRQQHAALELAREREHLGPCDDGAHLRASERISVSRPISSKDPHRRNGRCDIDGRLPSPIRNQNAYLERAASGRDVRRSH